MAVRVALALTFADLLSVGAMRSRGEVQKDSSMVCCLKSIGTNFEMRLINALQAATTKKLDIKKECKLITLPPTSCDSNSAECEKQCEQN